MIKNKKRHPDLFSKKISYFLKKNHSGIILLQNLNILPIFRSKINSPIKKISMKILWKSDKSNKKKFSFFFCISSFLSSKFIPGRTKTLLAYRTLPDQIAPTRSILYSRSPFQRHDLGQSRRVEFSMINFLSKLRKK
jgi:hypothetical protein